MTGRIGAGWSGGRKLIGLATGAAALAAAAGGFVGAERPAHDLPSTMS
jgi:hypothetical protein